MARIYQSTVIDAPVARVWEILRDFNGHQDWHPAIAQSRIEDGKQADQIGAVRQFTLVGGENVREQLLSLSDAEHSFVYTIVESDLPISNYRAEVILKPVTGSNQTFWLWRSSFDAPPGEEAKLSKNISEGIYQAGFQAVRDKLRNLAPSSGEQGASQDARAKTIRAEAIVIGHHGGPEVLREMEIDVAPPGPGQVRIKQHAIGVNYIDVYCRNGSFDMLTLPAVPGMEAAGEVDSVGDGVTGFHLGQQVAYACTPPGAYTSVRNMDAGSLVPLPEFVDSEMAASVLLKGMTSEILLHRVHKVQPGESVLVYAAAGGVGNLLCQWASHLGATVIGVTSTREKAEVAKKAGAHYVITLGATSFASQISDITDGRGVDVIYDGIGKDTFRQSVAALAKCGHLVSYGEASGPVSGWDLKDLASGSLTLSNPYFGDFTDTPEKLKAVSDRLFDAIEQGVIKVSVGGRFPLKEAAEAHRFLESRQSTGSIVLLPDRVIR